MHSQINIYALEMDHVQAVYTQLYSNICIEHYKHSRIAQVVSSSSMSRMSYGNVCYGRMIDDRLQKCFFLLIKFQIELKIEC